MQNKNHTKQLSHVPEYFLYWTFQRPDLLKSVLYTVENNKIRIINPGERNPDNGPDFRNAEIQIDGVVFRGDVEFHLHWRDWYQHGHNEDRRYQQVILHVLWERPDQFPSELSSQFPHLVLSTALKYSFDKWYKTMKTLETTWFCDAQANQNISFNLHQLEELAWHRFARRCEEVRSMVSQYGWVHSLYIGLAGSLGYSKNKNAFMRLIKQFSPEKLIGAVHPLQRSPLLFWIMLGWQAGLFNRPMQNQPHQMKHRLLQVLLHVRRQFADQFPISSQNLIQWNFSRLRPHNSPYLRLAGFAQILYHYQVNSLFKEILTIFASRKPLSEILNEVERTLCLPVSPSFQPYFQEILKIRQFPGRAMGRQRCHQFVLNFLLPIYYVWAQIQHQQGFQIYLEGLYFQFPTVDDNHIVRNLIRNQSHLPQNRGFIQQALLEYHQQCQFKTYSEK